MNMETNIALARSRSRSMMHLQLNQHRRNLKTAVVVNDFQMRISAMATSTQPHTVYLVTKFWKNIWIWDPTFDLMELCILLQQRVSHGKITLLLASSLVRLYVFLPLGSLWSSCQRNHVFCTGTIQWFVARPGAHIGL